MSQARGSSWICTLRDTLFWVTGQFDQLLNKLCREYNVNEDVDEIIAKLCSQPQQGFRIHSALLSQSEFYGQ